MLYVLKPKKKEKKFIRTFLALKLVLHYKRSLKHNRNNKYYLYWLSLETLHALESHFLARKSVKGWDRNAIVVSNDDFQTGKNKKKFLNVH